MRLLIVEDEVKMARALKQGLERLSYAVDICHDGDSGLSMASSEPYDLIILDRMLPGTIDGMGVLAELRTLGNQVPVLMLTAKDKVLDRAAGLNTGADDYLTKPFVFVELIARIRALLRRPPEGLGTTLTCGDLRLDGEHSEVSRAGKKIDLTAREFALLEYMMRNPGKVLSKEVITKQVWSYDADILPNTVEVYMGYLRAKIDKPFQGSKLINTKRGFGYFLGVVT